MYSLFVLERDGQAFLGVTELDVRQRIRLLYASARRPSAAGFTSPLSCWLRELDSIPVRPSVRVLLQSEDPILIKEAYMVELNRLKSNGQVLNVAAGRALRWIQ